MVGGAVVSDRSIVDPLDRCSFSLGDDGRFRLHVETDGLTGTIIETALVEARDALFQGGRSDVTWLDSVREVAERSLDAVTSPARRNRFGINIHLDTSGGAVDAIGACLPDGCTSPHPETIGRNRTSTRRGRE